MFPRRKVKIHAIPDLKHSVKFSVKKYNTKFQLKNYTKLKIMMNVH